MKQVIRRRKQVSRDTRRIRKAVSCFNRGFNCCQAIVSTYGRQFGLNSNASLKIGSALGGGICRTGETCGVVTGALMVLGLRNGQLKAIDKPAKELCYRIAARFISMFIARNHSIKCKELLGYDISTIQGRKMVRKRHLISTLCPRLVQDGAEIIEKMLEEKPNAAT